MGWNKQMSDKERRLRTNIYCELEVLAVEFQVGDLSIKGLIKKLLSIVNKVRKELG